jgi:hypothetical protein
MTELIDRIVYTREEAHQAAKQVYELTQRLIADGKRARISAQEDEDDRSIQQNRFYWGVILRQTSEQARIDGQRYTDEAWHELGKRQFLGYEIKKVPVAGRKKLTVIRRLRSTTELKVRPMSKYLEEFIAFAVTDLGVRFTETRWEDYRA